MRTFRIVLWTLVVVAALGATALFVFNMDRQNRGETSMISTIGSGQFALVDQRGNAVDNSIFKGKPTLLFFGYTHCPDVCPTTMGEMQGWFSALGDEAKSLQGVFITVDPERDTPQILGDYVGFVSDRIHALTGTPEEINKVVRNWGAMSEKVPQDDGNYLVNHTASVFLVDSRGQFFRTIAYGEPTNTALEKIRQLLASS